MNVVNTEMDLQVPQHFLTQTTTVSFSKKALLLGAIFQQSGDFNLVQHLTDGRQNVVRRIGFLRV